MKAADRLFIFGAIQRCVSSNATLVWKGDDLQHTASGKPVAQIVSDGVYPGMWRVRLADGTVSGMLYKTRARAPAQRPQETGPVGVLVRLIGRAARWQ
jgi:hypothetical protein